MNFNWQKIANYNIIKSFSSELKIEEVKCDVRYYEEYPLDDVSAIVLDEVYENGGSIDMLELAAGMGFSIEDDFNAFPKKYKDNSEFALFKSLIDSILDWSLISIANECISITELGNIAQKTRKKFKFHSGEKALLICDDIEKDNGALLSYYSEFGVSPKIENESNILVENLILKECFKDNKDILVAALNLQAEHNLTIFHGSKSKYFTFSSLPIDVILISDRGEYYPLICHKNKICVSFNDALYSGENEKLVSRLVREGLFRLLMDNPESVLNYKAIQPFIGIIKIPCLIVDKRVCWSDEDLFKFIVSDANADDWSLISQYCPFEFVKPRLKEYKDFFVWTILSQNVDDMSFVVKNCTKYKWDFEVILQRDDMSIQNLKSLILCHALDKSTWDWKSIMPKLDDEFILSNIGQMDFDLIDFTKHREEDLYNSINDFPEKKWDWVYISENFQLQFIFRSISKIGKYLILPTVIDRFCECEEWIEKFCSSKKIYNLIHSCLLGSLRFFSVNKKSYCWNVNLIRFFEDLHLLQWNSTNFILGFECNEHVNWNLGTFKEFYNRNFSDSGYSFVSKKITDYNIVLKFPNFQWDWDQLSSNLNIINHEKFIETVFTKLNINILVRCLSPNMLEKTYEILDLQSYINSDEDVCIALTERYSLQFIRSHSRLRWNWKILTQRFFHPDLRLQISNPHYIDKWDWDYLSSNLELSFICENLAKFNEYWNWHILVNERFKYDYLLKFENVKKIASCIYYLKSEQLKRAIWSDLTKRFYYEDIAILMDTVVETQSDTVFLWDYESFYNSPEFSLIDFFQKHLKSVNWDALSQSDKVNKLLSFYEGGPMTRKNWKSFVDSLLIDNSDYKWNYQLLSRLKSVSSSYYIVSNVESHRFHVRNSFNDSWDWDFLSLNASFFKSQMLRRIQEFKYEINFKLLSRRTDLVFSRNIFEKTINMDWDWDALSGSSALNVDGDFIVIHKDKEWNWHNLSSNQFVKLCNDDILHLIDKSWDWYALSSREDLVFDEDFVIKIFNSDVHLDWNSISKKDEFVTSQELLLKFSDFDLDWSAISSNMNLDILSLDNKLLNKLDWTVISMKRGIELYKYSKYKKYINWHIVSGLKDFNPEDINLKSLDISVLDWGALSGNQNFSMSYNNLHTYKQFLDWDVINRRKDFVISNCILDEFKDYIDWTNASSSQDITFSEALIDKYHDKWDWPVFLKNPIIIKYFSNAVKKYKTGFNISKFVDRIGAVSFLNVRTQPFVYHFTHLFNAIDIIKNHKILSRARTNLNIGNSAGTVVNRRTTAYSYARFYFRPLTPTQFYNECLGWDSFLMTSFNKSYYDKALALGLPKCPMPVFFKFDLSEVLNKMPEKCYYSTGDMQSDWARIVRVIDDPNAIRTDFLYKSVQWAFNYAKDSGYGRNKLCELVNSVKENAQQEFLVKDELDFAGLNSLEIICFDKMQSKILKSYIDNNEIRSRITYEDEDEKSLFHRNNRKLIIQETGETLSFTSEYKSDSSFFRLQCDNLKRICVLNPGDCQKEDSNSITIYPKLVVKKTNLPFEVHFIDLRSVNTDWLVYKNNYE
jgi:hypothetical protein